MSSFKVIGLCGALLAAATLLTPAAAQTPALWQHGLTTSDLDSAFTRMAGAQTFAKDQKLTLHYVRFNSDALALKALIAGELDSYEGNPASPIIAASRGIDVKVIGCYWPGLTYGIFAKASIKTPKDLAGKTIAISAPNSLPDILTRAILSNNNIDPKQVRFAGLGNDAARFNALYAGAADAVAASTSYTPIIQKGYALLVSALDAAPQFVRLCTYVSSQGLARHREAAVRFLAAEMKGLDFALKNRAAFIGLAAELARTKANDPRPAYIFDEVTRYAAIDPKMPIPAAKLDWLQNLLVKGGGVRKKIAMSAFIDDSVRKAALETAKLN